jgi:hypothetical protein
MPPPVPDQFPGFQRFRRTAPGKNPLKDFLVLGAGEVNNYPVIGFLYVLIRGPQTFPDPEDRFIIKGHGEFFLFPSRKYAKV